MELKQASLTLSALAHEVRLSIFRLLVAEGPMAAGPLAKAIGVSPSTLSFHVKDLRFAGLIDTRKEGRHVLHSANFDALNQMLGFLAEDCCNGRPELCIQIKKSCAAA